MNARIALTLSVLFVLAPAGVAADPPETVELTGVVRDFRESHPSFEVRPDNGFGQYVGLVSTTLAPGADPEYAGQARRLVEQYLDADGNRIAPNLYDPALGDVEGELGATDSVGVTAATLAQWYSDVLGTNMSKPLTIALERQADGTYVYESSSFFPIDGEMFGNSGGSPNHNYHFTYEIRSTFTYHADGGQIFAFRGDDDVWVYIDGKLVIDLGGIHGVAEQVVPLERLGLVDGETYTLDFFFAERHRTESNFRMTTNMALVSQPIPTINAVFD